MLKPKIMRMEAQCDIMQYFVNDLVNEAITKDGLRKILTPGIKKHIINLYQ